MAFAGRRHVPWLAALLLGAVACGGQSPTAPTGPQPVALSLAAGPSSILRAGSTLAITVTAVLPDGSITVPAGDARWVTDTPSVLRVLPTGNVTGLAAGRATVTATYRGVSGSLPLRIVPDVAGTWEGTGHSTACDGFWDFRTCSRFVPERSTGQLTLTLVQDDDRVSGDLTLDITPPSSATYALPHHYLGSLRGAILEDGTVTLAGDTSVRLTSGGTLPSGTILGWRTTHPGGAATGTFTHVFPSTDVPTSVGRIEWTIDRLSR